MAEAQLQQFLAKVQALNAFVALSQADASLRQELADCGSHHEVVALARRLGFEIGRRWGEADSPAGGEDNLLASALPEPGCEHTRVLLETPQLRLVQIHSNQASSPDGFWYDQSEHEWVLLLQGSAQLRLAGERATRLLNTGDQLLIPAGQRHRVDATDPAPGTIWLALFWPADGAN